jgi:hypothetical protein
VILTKSDLEENATNFFNDAYSTVHEHVSFHSPATSINLVLPIMTEINQVKYSILFLFNEHAPEVSIK